jgi:hypothetical protein
MKANNVFVTMAGPCSTEQIVGKVGRFIFLSYDRKTATSKFNTFFYKVTTEPS